MGNAGIMWIVYKYKRAGRRARLCYMLVRFELTILFRWEFGSLLLAIVRGNQGLLSCRVYKVLRLSLAH